MPKIKTLASMKLFTKDMPEYAPHPVILPAPNTVKKESFLTF